MLHIIFRAVFSDDIIMADHVLFCQLQFPAEPRRQLYKSFFCFLRKFPRIVRVTALDGNCVLIARIIGIGNLIKRNALEDLPVNADNIMAAGRNLIGSGLLCQICLLYTSPSPRD